VSALVAPVAASLSSLGFWEAVLAGGFRFAVPIGLAAVGELIGERAGVLNVGVEGTMALGAIGGVAGAAAAGPTLGLVTGAAVGAVVVLLFGLLVVRLRANEVVVGFALALGGVALATFLYRAGWDSPPDISPFRAVEIPGLADIPILGAALFDQPVIVWLLPVVVVGTALALRRTLVGLRVRAAGDGPEAARARGVDVARVRIGACVAAGALGGLGGAVLVAGLVGEFSDQVIGGRGFVALAVVIAARWRPGLVIPIVFGIGSLQSFQLRAQATSDIDVPVALLQALPFLVTLIVLAIGVGAAAAPRALGRLEQEPAA
jgi:simple sugar transport system permease protein